MAAFKEVIQVCHGLMKEIELSTATFINTTRSCIRSKTYLKGLSSLQRLAAFEMFDFDGHEEAFQLQTLFKESIISDCGEAVLALNDDVTSSVVIFNKTLQEMMCVCAVYKDDKLIEALISLIAHVGLVYEGITSRFQDMIVNCDVHLFSKAKADAETIDLLRSHELVKVETESQFQSLVSAVKVLIEIFLKQAIEQIGYIANMSTCDWVAAAQSTVIGKKDMTPLKDLILLITDASTMHGDLKIDCKCEFNVLHEKINSLLKCFNGHIKEAELDLLGFFRNQVRLTSLNCERYTLLALSKIISDCNGLAPSLVSFLKIISNAVSKSDKAVTNVATRGTIVILNRRLDMLSCNIYLTNIFLTQTSIYQSCQQVCQKL